LESGIHFLVSREISKIRGKKEKVYRTKISDLDELKRRIDSEWAALSHTAIECAVG